jgi:ribosomal protein S27AE
VEIMKRRLDTDLKFCPACGKAMARLKDLMVGEPDVWYCDNCGYSETEAVKRYDA